MRINLLPIHPYILLEFSRSGSSLEVRVFHSLMILDSKFCPTSPENLWKYSGSSNNLISLSIVSL